MSLINFLNLLIHQAYAVDYVQPAIIHQATPITSLPYLDTFERLILWVVFFILVRPLLKEKKDPQSEAERKSLLKWVTLLAVLALLLRSFRFLTGY